MTDAPAFRAPAPTFLGHPRGLGWLSGAEFWERFSFYGMQALLVLYMTHELLRPGHIEHVLGFGPLHRAIESIYGPLSGQGLASVIFGAYAGLVFLTPVGGGFLADRVLGRARTVTLGALLMAAGHFMMAFEATFLVALCALLIGAGCFKGNIAAQVGELYPQGDPRSTDGFQIYFVAISLAIIVAPLVCGTLGERFGFHFGFATAGIGMLLGLWVYRRALRFVPTATSYSGNIRKNPRQRFTPHERAKLIVMVSLLPLFGIIQVVNYQVYNAYIVWAEASYRLEAFGWPVPVTWLFSFGSLVSVLTIIGSVAFWRHWARRRVEPNEITKMTLSGLILSIGPLVPALGSHLIATTGTRIGLGWAVPFEVINDLGYANFLPVGLALYSRAAPRALGGSMAGIYYLHLFFANMLAGWLGSFLSRMSATQFWLLHAGVVFCAAGVLLLARNSLGKLLTPTAATLGECGLRAAESAEV